jgi:hypothetical protein
MDSNSVWEPVLKLSAADSSSFVKQLNANSVLGPSLDESSTLNGSSKIRNLSLKECKRENKSHPLLEPTAGSLQAGQEHDDLDVEKELETACLEREWRRIEDNVRIQAMIMLRSRPVATKNRAIRSEEVKRGPSLEKWFYELVEWNDDSSTTNKEKETMEELTADREGDIDMRRLSEKKEVLRKPSNSGYFDVASDTKELEGNASIDGEEVIDKDAASEMKASRPSVMKKQAISRKPSEVGACYWGRDDSKETSKTSRTVVREVVPGHYLVCREEV